LSAFIPVFFESTINNGSPYALLIPVLLFAIYSFMHSEEGHLHAASFIASSIILPLIHPSAIILTITIIIYLILIKLEKFKTTINEKKLLLFSLISPIILVVLFYKAIDLHGLGVVSANLPIQIISNFFAQTSIIEAVYKIGLLTVFYGTYAVSKNIDRLTKHNTFIFAFISTAAILLWIRKIELNIGLSLLGIGLTIIIATKYQSLINYIQKTKLPSYKWGLSISTLLAFLLTALAPSYFILNDVAHEAPSTSDVAVLAWLKDKAPEGSVVAAAVKDGNFITGFAGKKDIIDTNFMMKTDAQQRYDDVVKIFETSSAVDILGKYNVDYVFISQNVLEDYDLKQPAFYNDSTCFKPIIKGASSLYQVTCIKRV
jgi:hypothetical protein